MSTIPLPKAVEDFVAANNRHDADALMGTLAPNAVIFDDGTIYTQDSDIREWIGSHLVVPNIVISPTCFVDGQMLAVSAGDYPGSPQSFAFTFDIAGKQVMRLSIEPA